MGEKLTTPQPMEPVHTTIIGVGSSDSKFLASGTVATTPGSHQPDLVLNVVNPLVAILVRFGNIFCLTFVGALSAGGVSGAVIPHGDFVTMLKPALLLALCTAGVGFVKDLGTIFSGLEKRFPLATGNV